MSIRPTRSFVWLLLALLGLRGLVPAGHMIEANADGLSIVVCGSGIYAAAAQQTQSMHAAHDHAQHQHEGAADHSSHGSSHDGSEHAGADHSICPFAIAATGALGSLSIAPMVADVSIGDITIEFSQYFSSFGPSRAQQSRAPPSFS